MNDRELLRIFFGLFLSRGNRVNSNSYFHFQRSAPLMKDKYWNSQKFQSFESIFRKWILRVTIRQKCSL